MAGGCSQAEEAAVKDLKDYAAATMQEYEQPSEGNLKDCMNFARLHGDGLEPVEFAKETIDLFEDEEYARKCGGYPKRQSF